jgi:general secretion pathway protein I
MSFPVKRRAAGFTLLEVMVAVAILALSLSVLLTFQGNTMIASGRQERLTVATMLAREKMVEVELELEAGMQKGEFPDERSEEEQFDTPFENYRWKMEIRKVELPAPVSGEEGSVQDMIAKQLTKEIAKTVRELRLSVSWNELGEEQSIEVVTHLVKL